MITSIEPVSKHRPSYFTPKVRFTPEEDMLLKKTVDELGPGDWHAISEKIPGRNARQCRERWANYVNPAIVAAPWTEDEDNLLRDKYDEYGPRWCTIATFFPTRSTNNIKNRYVSLKRRKSKNMKKMQSKNPVIEKEKLALSLNIMNFLRDFGGPTTPQPVSVPTIRRYIK